MTNPLLGDIPETALQFGNLSARALVRLLERIAPKAPCPSPPREAPPPGWEHPHPKPRDANGRLGERASIDRSPV